MADRAALPSKSGPDRTIEACEFAYGLSTTEGERNDAFHTLLRYARGLRLSLDAAENANVDLRLAVSLMENYDNH